MRFVRVWGYARIAWWQIFDGINSVACSRENRFLITQIRTMCSSFHYEKSVERAFQLKIVNVRIYAYCHISKLVIETVAPLPYLHVTFRQQKHPVRVVRCFHSLSDSILYIERYETSNENYHCVYIWILFRCLSTFKLPQSFASRGLR